MKYLLLTLMLLASPHGQTNDQPCQNPTTESRIPPHSPSQDGTKRPPKPTTLTSNQWRTDLRHLTDQVRYRHPNPFHYGASREDYIEATKRLHRRIPKLSDQRIVLELFRIHAMLEDGHSEPLWSSIPRKLLDPSSVPIRFHFGRDGYFAERTTKPNQEHLGALLTHIDSRPIDEVLTVLEPYISGDNERNRRTIATHFLIAPSILFTLGLAKAPDRITYTLTLPGKPPKSVEMQSERSTPDASWVRLFNTSSNPMPLWLRNTRDAYWFDYIAKDQLLYMQFNRVQNKPGEDIATFSRRMFATIDEKRVKKLVIDLRHNSGGDNSLVWPLIHRIALNPNINRTGHFFVIFGSGTKSAAPSFAKRLEQLTNVVFVGEPTGGRPNGHGNTSTIRLPHSKIHFRCSGLFVRPMPTPDHRPWLTPHITAELRAEDAAKNRDPALQAIIDYKPSGSLSRFIAARGGLTTAANLIKDYRRFRGVHRNKWINVELEINALGYRLLRSGKVTEATAVFRFNALEYPYSPNVYDSLAEAHALGGDTNKAIELYKRAFAIDKSLVNPIRQISRLRQR